MCRFMISIINRFIPMIYSLVAREQVVLIDHSNFSGNFSQISLDVLQRTNLRGTFGQYATANYSFYTLVKDRIVILVMVESKYERRIAANYLKQIQESFFSRYNQDKRNQAVAHSLKDFKPILADWMQKYNNREEVDKLSKLKKVLNEAEQEALANLDRIIQRGEKIQILVKKSETLADQSYDLRDTSRAVKNKMWWKNKKIMIGIIVVVVLIITVVIIVVAA